MKTPTTLVHVNKRTMYQGERTTDRPPTEPFNWVFVNREPWMKDALCAQIGYLDIFYPEVPSPAANDAGLAVCAKCPVSAACLKYALDNDEEGIWGGTTDSQRAAILRGGERGL